jgi:hypothetical protein
MEKKKKPERRGHVKDYAVTFLLCICKKIYKKYFSSRRGRVTIRANLRPTGE